MNEIILLSVYGTVIYVAVAIGTFGALTTRWSDPWPGDKAFALAVFWPMCLALFLGKNLVTGVIKLAKDFAS